MPQLQPGDAAYVIMAGLAGALDPQLAVGDVVVDQAARQHLPASTLRFAPFHTSRDLVSTVEQKSALFSHSQAALVEMENDLVRDAATRAGARFIGIRAISDSANDTLDPNIFRFINETGRLKIAALLKALLRRPPLLIDLLRLRKNSSIALTNLAQAVQLIVESLATQ